MNITGRPSTCCILMVAAEYLASIWVCHSSTWLHSLRLQEKGPHHATEDCQVCTHDALQHKALSAPCRLLCVTAGLCCTAVARNTSTPPCLPAVHLMRAYSASQLCCAADHVIAVPLQCTIASMTLAPAIRKTKQEPSQQVPRPARLVATCNLLSSTTGVIQRMIQLLMH
jgi:hypothetical protein